MKTDQNRLMHSFYIIAGFIVVTILIVFGIYQILYLQKAHSTFENYYAFRGCTKMLEKTSDYGRCSLKNGQVIKIVKFQEKWYLDGDLLCGFLCF